MAALETMTMPDGQSIEVSSLKERTPERRTEEERKWFEGVLVKAIGDGEEMVGAAIGLMHAANPFEDRRYDARTKAHFDSFFDDENRRASMLSCLVLLRSMARATSVEWADGSSDNDELKNVAQQPELRSKFLKKFSKFPDDVESHPRNMAARLLEKSLCLVYERTLRLYKEEHRGGDIWLRRRQWRVRHVVSTDGIRLAVHVAPDLRSDIVCYRVVGEVLEAFQEHDGWIFIEPRGNERGGFCAMSLSVKEPPMYLPLLERVSRGNERALEVVDAFHKADPEDWQKQIIENTNEDPYRGAPFDFESLASFIFRKAQLHSSDEEDNTHDLSLTFDPDIVVTAPGHEVRGRGAAMLWIKHENIAFEHLNFNGIHPEDADTPNLRGEPNRVVFIGDPRSDRFVGGDHEMVFTGGPGYLLKEWNITAKPGSGDDASARATEEDPARFGSRLACRDTLDDFDETKVEAHRCGPLSSSPGASEPPADASTGAPGQVGDGDSSDEPAASEQSLGEEEVAELHARMRRLKTTG